MTNETAITNSDRERLLDHPQHIFERVLLRASHLLAPLEFDKLLGERLLQLLADFALVSGSVDFPQLLAHLLLLLFVRIVDASGLQLFLALIADALDVDAPEVILAWTPLRLDSIGVDALLRNEWIVRIGVVHLLVDVAVLLNNTLPNQRYSNDDLRRGDRRLSNSRCGSRCRVPRASR
jgi:hypothetical protein